MFQKGIIRMVMVLVFLAVAFPLQAFWGGKSKMLAPKDGRLMIPVKDISDGQAHYFQAKADDGLLVSFFAVKSKDDIIRAAVDACDVCYKSGKGYTQDKDHMVCGNCGMRFATDRINDVKGGCNPAPLTRTIEGEYLVIQMKDINANSWYCKFKEQ